MEAECTQGVHFEFQNDRSSAGLYEPGRGAWVESVFGLWGRVVEMRVIEPSYVSEDPSSSCVALSVLGLGELHRRQRLVI